MRNKLASPIATLTRCALLLLLLSCGMEEAQETHYASNPTLFSTFQQQEALPFHIKADIEMLLRREQPAEKYSAKVTYPFKNKNIVWKVALSPRGNMRNRYCDLPPLKLDFIKEDLTNAGYNATFDDVKLVHPCKDDEEHRTLVLREYLAYKLYNELTDFSFRVQLLDLSLEDSKGMLYKVESKAFVIEKDDELAHRLNGRVLKPSNVSRDALQADVFDMMCLFQYMIGNTDWHIYNQHNIKTLKVEGQLFPIPVPYDFDYAGIVDAEYAIPEERLPLSDIKERYYLGPCRTHDDLEPIFQHFKNKKERLLNICSEFTPLKQAIRGEMTAYIKDFFKILEDDTAREQMIVKHCNRQIKRK